MTRLAGITAVLVLVTARVVEAHRLDEYLQATRLAVAADHIVLHIGLTPGISVADDVIRRLDQDGDGSISPSEAETYAREVVRDLTLSVDDTPLLLELNRVDVPTPDELREGEGTIRIDASSDTAMGSPGHHQLELRNRHLPDRSVYLANALMPDSSDVRLIQQSRDLQQRVFWLDYEVRPRYILSWLCVVGIAMSALIRFRRG